MRFKWTLLTGLFPSLAIAQTGVYAYLPSQNSFLKLKSTQVESTIIGEVVRTSTDFTYEKPVSGVSEVSFNFELPQTATLGGFGYFDGDQFVQGRLQVKLQGSGVNSEVVPGLRETGVVDRPSASVYRCEIVPSMQGNDLRIRVWTLGMLQPVEGNLTVPKPNAEIAIKPGSPAWGIRGVKCPPLLVSGDNYTVGEPKPIAAVAQKFSDGRYYVAGYIHSKKGVVPRIEIEGAFYEPVNGKKGGKDVTAKVAEFVRNRRLQIWASDAVFGDPALNVAKQLRVIAILDGTERTITVPENETMNLFGLGDNRMAPEIYGLRDLKTVFQDAGTVAFWGWATRPTDVSANFQGKRLVTRPRVIPRGSDAARLWAQQMLSTQSVGGLDKEVAFSLKFGILSATTNFVALSSSPTNRL